MDLDRKMVQKLIIGPEIGLIIAAVLWKQIIFSNVSEHNLTQKIQYIRFRI